MTPIELKNRTKQFGLRIIKLVAALPTNNVSYVLGKQLLRSGTSVGANYRAACRARSTAEFLAKLGIVEEECDESIYWLEMLVDGGQLKAPIVSELIKEGNEILAIVVSSIRTTRKNETASARAIKATPIRSRATG